MVSKNFSIKLLVVFNLTFAFMYFLKIFMDIDFKFLIVAFMVAICFFTFPYAFPEK